MSVVVFDGVSIAADSLMIIGDTTAYLKKVGTTSDFAYGFVGSPSVARAMVAAFGLRVAWRSRGGSDMGTVGFDLWNGQLSERILEDGDGTKVLIVPQSPTANTMLLLTPGLPTLEMVKQPIYLGAVEGESLFNYCRATRDIFAPFCVDMCVTASSMSAQPFAAGPVNVVSVHEKNDDQRKQQAADPAVKRTAPK